MHVGLPHDYKYSIHLDRWRRKLEPNFMKIKFSKEINNNNNNNNNNNPYLLLTQEKSTPVTKKQKKKVHTIDQDYFSLSRALDSAQCIGSG
jgi:hypothetical protein